MSLTIENNILMKNGKPFFYLADTCWSAFTNIKDNDWDYYLDYRKSQGFNTLQINILPQWDASATDLCYEPFEVIDGKYTTVSKRHCGIRFDPFSGLYTVTDYSSNGTYINGGTKLQPHTPLQLQPNTVVSIGKGSNSFRLN